MASPFAKYQSEQVQQIAPGFVEAFAKSGASIGQGLASAGESIAKGMHTAEAKKQEEAKIQGMLSPYLKTDQRVQSVKQNLTAGWLKKDDAGNVYIPDEHKDKFDPAKATDAISFYNETGGDGSKLTGPALTKFATAFEAEKKYAAEQAGLEDKRIEKLKTLAEIRKMDAEAAEKYGKIGRSEILGAFASGTDMSNFTPSPGVQAPPSVLAGTPYELGGAGLAARGTSSAAAPSAGSSILSNTVPAATFTAPKLGTDLVQTGAGYAFPSTGFTPERFLAGMPTATALKTATPSPAKSTTTPVKTGAAPAPAPSAVTTPMKLETTTTGTSAAYLQEIPKLQQARTQLDQAWQKDITSFSANYQMTLSRYTASGASTEEIKALNETFQAQYKLKSERYAANVASIADRLAGFEKSAAEARAAQTSTIAVSAEERAKADEQRAKDKAEMTKVEFETKYGKPVEAGKETPESDKKETFSATIQSRVQNAGIIPGRTGGTEQTNLRRAAQEEHTKIMRDYPTWYNVGLTTKGGDEYQMKLLSYPTSAPIDPTIKAKVDESVVGYTEGRTFLTELLDAVNGTDEARVKNYLNRFLATTSKDEEFVTGQMLGQFGVAAFRRAIVSGGNFSDADREYVQKIITQINTPNPFAKKETLIAQTKRLAEFIDSKFRAGLSAQGVRVDLDTAKQFLTREKDEVGLAELAKTEAFYRAYKIDTKSNKVVSRGNETLDPAELRQRAEAARKAGNDDLAKTIEQIIKENQKAKDEAAKKAAEAAAKARGA